MNQQQISSKFTFWVISAILKTSSVLAIANPIHPTTQYQVNEIGSKRYQITNATQSILLELVPGDGSLIRVNGKLMSLDLTRSRNFNEKQLTKLLSEKALAQVIVGINAMNLGLTNKSSEGK